MGGRGAGNMPRTNLGSSWQTALHSQLSHLQRHCDQFETQQQWFGLSRCSLRFTQNLAALGFVVHVSMDTPTEKLIELKIDHFSFSSLVF